MNNKKRILKVNFFCLINYKRFYDYCLSQWQQPLTKKQLIKKIEKGIKLNNN
jgi:hypothetical protein